MARAPALLAVLCTAAAASAQTGAVTYSWDVNDTGSSTAVISPGETVKLRMYATWDPYDGSPLYAGTIFEILGLEHWDTGTITRYDNLIDSLGIGEGDLQPDNDILDIQSFQLPPLFNQYFRDNYPIDLYVIEWTPHDYTARTVRLTDANHLNNSFYVDDFGTSVEYDANPSEGATIHIISAPATVALLACAYAARRRRG